MLSSKRKQINESAAKSGTTKTGGAATGIREPLISKDISAEGGDAINQSGDIRSSLVDVVDREHSGRADEGVPIQIIIKEDEMNDL